MSIAALRAVERDQTGVHNFSPYASVMSRRPPTSPQLPQFPCSAFRSCADGEGELLDPRRVEPPRKVWLFPLPLLPQKPGCRSARTLSLARLAPGHKGRQTYLSFIRMNAPKRLSSCCARPIGASEGPSAPCAAELAQRSSSSIAASRVGTCSLRRIAET